MKSWTIATLTLLWASLAHAQATPPPSPPIPDFRAFDFSDLKSVEILAPAAEAREHLHAAEEHKRAGRWQQAIGEASAAIRLNPELIEAHRLRANIYNERGLCRRAIADFSEVVRLDPGDRMGFLLRGWVRCKDRDFERGFADLDATLSLSRTNQDRALIHFWRGRCLELRAEPISAAEEYRRALQLGLDSVEVRLQLGQVLARLGDHEAAIDEYGGVILSSASPQAWYDRGESRMARGEFALARADYERAIELDPSGPWYHRGRGRARLALGEVDGAIEDFGRALELSPNDRLALADRGWARLAKRDLGRAIADFDGSLALQQRGVRLEIDYWLGSSFPLNSRLDHDSCEFDRRNREAPNGRWTAIDLRGEECRSQALESPYLEFCLVRRLHPDPRVAACGVLRVVVEWRGSPEAAWPAIGRAIAQARRANWREADDSLDTAAMSVLDALVPGLMRPTLREGPRRE